MTKTRQTRAFCDSDDGVVMSDEQPPNFRLHRHPCQPRSESTVGARLVGRLRRCAAGVSLGDRLLLAILTNGPAPLGTFNILAVIAAARNRWLTHGGAATSRGARLPEYKGRSNPNEVSVRTDLIARVLQHSSPDSDQLPAHKPVAERMLLLQIVCRPPSEQLTQTGSYSW